jgi:hypothetical protein
LTITVNILMSLVIDHFGLFGKDVTARDIRNGGNSHRELWRCWEASAPMTIDLLGLKSFGPSLCGTHQRPRAGQYR